MGKASLETWKTNRFMDLFIGGVLSSPGLLLSHYIGTWGGAEVFLDLIWIKYVVPFLTTEFLRKKSGRYAYGRDAPFKLFIAALPVISSTQRYFFSRILTNRFTSMGPSAIYYEDPMEDFVAAHASDQSRGDINLKFSLTHRKSEGRMGVNQATFPQTAIMGTSIFKGRPEVIDVLVNVPQEKDASKEENSLLDNTIGVLGLMIAAKTIGVEMARVASYDGRLFNLSSTFSSAGVHTTQINPIVEEVRKILDSGREKPVTKPAEIVEPVQLKIPFVSGHRVKSSRPRSVEPVLTADNAMGTSPSLQSPGGIAMDSRFMKLKVRGEMSHQKNMTDNAMLILSVQGMIPRVTGILPVTPDMLKTMLAEGYLN